MSEKLTRMAAQFQEQYRVPHESGYDISNFISVILRPDEKNPGEVKPEVYMISDQGQALERANLFVESNSRRKMQVRVKEKYPLPYIDPPMPIRRSLWEARTSLSSSLNSYW